jgi:hypothetical protein
MKKNFLVLLIILFSAHNLWAQEHECGMEAHMAELMKDSEFALQWELNQKKI